MGTTPPGFPPQDPNAPRDPNAPYDPTNVNDPRYDPSRDPRYDPRWQKAQQRAWRDSMRAQQQQVRAARKAQQAAWKMQNNVQRDQWKMYWRGQRQTSIVGPLLLIAVGVIFFLIHTGKISGFLFLTWYSRWWPALLIVFGLLRLAEWAIDRARQPEGAPVMRYHMGGGAITAIILLAALGLATHAFQWRADDHGLQFFGLRGGDGMDHLFGQKHEEDAPVVVHDIAATGLLTIDNPHGDVTVNGTSDDGKLHLSVHKQVFSNSDDTATKRLRDLDVTLDGSDDNLSLRVPNVDGGGADLTLLVPSTVRVQLNSNRGDVHVSNLKSPLSVTANNGDVDVAAITGPVQVHVNNRHHDLGIRSVTGDVTVDGNGNDVSLSDVSGSARINGDFFGGGHLSHIGGGVNYHSSRTDLTFTHLYGDFEIDKDDIQASEVVGPSLVNTRSRNITLDKVTGDIKVVNNHGDVDLHMALPIGGATVDNQNGNVTVTVPEKAKFWVQAETSDGDTHSDFDTVKSDGRGVLSGTVNGGGATVRVNTSHGDISVSRNSAGPLPPPPPMPKLSGVPAPPAPPKVSGGMPDTDAITRDAIAQAQQALDQSEQILRDAKGQSAAAREQSRKAIEQAREALKEAQQKTKEAARGNSY
jgi:DUF4097 and DUF4098 domain-containing protein YvlB